MTRSHLRVGGAALVAAALFSSTHAHEGDPKVLDHKPAYQGPGYRRNAAIEAVTRRLDGQLAPSASFQGTGMTGGLAGVPDFPSNGVTLMSWLPLGDFGSFVTGNDCWGYTAPSGREYAIIGLNSATAFVEVTNPADAQIVEVIDGVDSLWRDVKVYQDHAYSVSEGGDGIQVFDMGQIDNGIVNLVNTITSGPGTTASHNVAIDEDSGFLYRVGGTDVPSFQDRGLRAFSLANPSNPVFVGEWSDKYIHDAQIVTYDSGPYAGRQIAFVCSGLDQGFTNTGLDIVDVTNKNNMFVRGSLQYSNNEYSHQAWLSEDRQFLFLNDELDENGAFPSTTIVIDVSDIDNPFTVTTFTNGDAAVTHNNYVLGDLMFASNYTHGLRIWDVSDPGNATETAFFDTWPEGADASFNSLWSNYPYFPSGTVIGSDKEKGLFVWYLGDPALTLSVVGGAPATLDPAGDTLTVSISELSPGELVQSSVTLHFDDGQGGFIEVPATALGGNQFQAQTPAAPCGGTVNYFFSAESQNGVLWTVPSGAPGATLSSTAILDQNTLLSFNMESNAGWVSGAPGDTATTGIWERVNPNGTSAQPEDDFSAVGTNCWVTGQGSIGGSVGENDVDGGFTTLRSAIFDLSSADSTVISYWRWFSNDQGSAANEDTLRVDITDDGVNWVNVETVGPSGPETAGGWFQHQFLVTDFVDQTSQVRLRFIAEDVINGSIVEAAIDDLLVEEVTCPTLYADKGSISLLSGGSQNFTLAAGPSHALDGYWLLGSISGTTPGFSLGSVNIPLNLDAYLTLTLQSANLPPFANSFGVLDADGNGAASFSLGSNFNPNLAGLQLHHAYFTYDLIQAEAEFASNAVSLFLVP